MIPYIKITIKIGDNEICISKNSKYRLIALSGFESADYICDISSYAGMDGGYISAYSVPPRLTDITFSVDVYPWTGGAESIRAFLISFFSPHANGLLIVERGGRTRCINFRIRGAIQFEQKNIIEDKLQIKVPMASEDPYFHDVEMISQDARKIMPLMSFPYVSMKNVGLTTGISVNSDSLIIKNLGDVPAGIVATINCYGGSVTNPKISCGDKYVKLIRNCTISDIIKIDTRKGKKNIYINGTSVFAFDRKSTFFELPVGESTISVSADANIGNAKTTVSYEQRYLGV